MNRIAGGAPELAPELVLGALAGVVVLLGLLAWHLWRRRRDFRHRIRRLLRHGGCGMLERVAVEDALGGHVHFDFLVLTPGGVLALELRDYEGTVFGAETMEEWTQITTAGSFRFPNPLPALAAGRDALRVLRPGLEVDACVLFSPAGRFQGTPPPGVLDLAGLRARLPGRRGCRSLPEAWRVEWLRLKAMLRQAPEVEAGAEAEAEAV